MNLHSMNTKVIERLREKFLNIGEEKVSGNAALKILDGVIEEFTIPKEVGYAIEYIRMCERDMGFMGSPEYYIQKKIKDDYYSALNLKRLEEAEKANYLRLKEKYGK